MGAGIASPIAFWLGGAGGFTKSSGGGGDTTAPTAAIGSHPNVTGTASYYDFTVVYSDDAAVDVASIATGNVVVSGPNAFSGTPTLQSIDTNTNGTPRTATYRLTPPGGSWDNGDNGTYTIDTADPPDAAVDTSGNPVASTTLGTFTVSVPVPGEAEGYYAKHAKMKRKAGINNLAIYSNLDNNTTDEDEDILQEAMDEADRYVDARALVLGVTADDGVTDGHILATTNTYFGRVSDLASAIAVAELYRARGVTGDAQNTAEGQMADMDAKAKAELDTILANIRIADEISVGSDGAEVLNTHGRATTTCRPCYPVAWPYGGIW